MAAILSRERWVETTEDNFGPSISLEAIRWQDKWNLTHGGQNKMADSLQMTFSIAFC